MAYIDEKEVARRLGVSVAFLRKARMTGIGGPPFRKFGALVRYSEADIDVWADAQLRPSTLTPALG